MERPRPRLVAISPPTPAPKIVNDFVPTPMALRDALAEAEALVARLRRSLGGVCTTTQGRKSAKADARALVNVSGRLSLLAIELDL